MDLRLRRKTKKRIKIFAKNIGQEVLWALKDLSVLVPKPFESKFEHMQRMRGYTRQQISKALWDVEKKGWVKKKIVKQRVVYELTDLGRVRNLRFAYGKKKKVARNDGFSTIVIFDIPEEYKKARNYLRRFLKENKFILLQKSVFIGPWSLEPEFKELLTVLKINKFVSVIEGRVVHD